MKIRSLYIASALLLGVGMSACSDEDYLGYDSDKNYSDELIWSEYTYIADMGSELYYYMPKTFQNYGGGFLASSTDDCESSNQRADIQKFNKGTWDMFDSPTGDWSRFYQGIYLANNFIAHADTATLYREQYNESAKKQHLRNLGHLRGQARFLKAYYYFELMKRYGAIPLAEEWTETYTPATYYRSDVSEVLELIEATALESVQLLPDVKNGVAVDKSLTGSEYNNYLGRPTMGTAYALLSRAYLYAASPLHNPTGTTDDYYEKSAMYSAMLFDRYKLASSYSELFKPGTATMRKNTEVILDRRSASGNSLESANFPTGFYSGSGKANPTQNLVDAFEMADGSDFDWSNPEHVANPYANRDARFEVTILHNGEEMGGRTVETWTGGRDAATDISLGTRTGYYLQKYIDTGLSLFDGNKALHTWYLFRYAEILLNYAEAMNELYGPDADPSGYGKTAISALNEVRTRAGQPALDVANYDQASLREKIRRERRVELAFENHRHWDVRRWRIAESTIGMPVQGVDISRSTSVDTDTGEEVENFTYTLKEVEERVFEPKMYLYPIPSSEILMSDDLEQNPGW